MKTGRILRLKPYLYDFSLGWQAAYNDDLISAAINQEKFDILGDSFSELFIFIYFLRKDIMEKIKY